MAERSGDNEIFEVSDAGGLGPEEVDERPSILEDTLDEGQGTDLDKLVIETAYLTAPNFARYRRILRFFYRQHQRLTYWMPPETVWRHLRQENHWHEYSLEQCQQDLAALVEWKNLIAAQDAGRVTTIEEFRNRRFRYQLTPYTIEIERLTMRLESIRGVGGSLEANLFERILDRLRLVPNQQQATDSQVHNWWQDLSSDFQRLNDNATDYIASLQGGELDQMADTAAFLTYKEKIVEYLRDFIRELQRWGTDIAQYLQDVPSAQILEILGKAAAHEASIPRLQGQLKPEAILQELQGQWQAMVSWFAGRDYLESERMRLLNATDTIIRRITRYANRMAESQNRAVSRHKEYMHLCQVFADSADIQEAHRLGGAIFGVTQVRHVQGEYQRATDSTNSGVFSEPAFVAEIRPKVRTFSERATVEGITDKRQQKQEALAAFRKVQEEEAAVLQECIAGSEIDFSQLTGIEPHVRHTLLRWVGRALASAEQHGRTEDGRSYHLTIDNSRQIILDCTDGQFTMPHTLLHFISAEVGRVAQ